MSTEIQIIHETIFNFLQEERKNNPKLRFSMRKSNRYDRLNQGYWFYGNENYVAVSFWSGSDWKNKTPNIFFGVYNNGYSFLEMSASDSEKKLFFFGEELRAWVTNLHPHRNGWRKDYNFKDDYIASLKSFLTLDKLSIDKAITETSTNYFSHLDKTFNRIGMIDPVDFEKRLENILKYKDAFNSELAKRPSVALRSIEIKDLFPIINLSILDIPNHVQWIFFTGLNGTGKSSILKALTAGICSNWDAGKQIYNTGNFKISILLETHNKKSDHHITIKTLHSPRVLSIGFAAYGASRQEIMVDQDTSEKSGIAYNLFNVDGKLLSLDKQILEWKIDQETQKKFPNAEQRISQIVDLLPDLIPSLIDIDIPEKTLYGIWSETLYTEEDENGLALRPVLFEELASGIRSLVGMLGDMLLRLYAMQPEISDPAELIGIVIIDEIDLHLHPILQKKLVEDLTQTFRKIQFVVSTHSPIPLLGAPKNSIVYNVTRNTSDGVCVKSLRNIDFSNMLPNMMLTSPIFGMEEIKPESNSDIRKMMVDNNYDDIEFFKMVEKRIDELAKEIND